MKYVKILGLAAVAAMAMMAFAAGSASATTLKSGGATITTIEGSLSGSAVLEDTTSATLDTCTVGSLSDTTEKDTAEGELKGIGSVSWGPKGSGCTQTTDTLKPGTLGITWTFGTNGTVKSYGAEVTVEIGGVSCVYGTSATGTTLGTLIGSETGNASLAVSTPVEFKSGSFLCPKSTVWTATYKVTNPKTLTVVK